jgi:hypothetical protein
LREKRVKTNRKYEPPETATSYELRLGYGLDGLEFEA